MNSPLVFAAPLGLLGLLTLPVILALHALRARSRRFPVPSIKMWSFMEKEVRGSRLRRVPLTLILILHLLIAALFSLALARPQLRAPSILHAARQVILLVDVSTSMGATDVSPTRLDQAKDEAKQMLGSLQEGDVGTVIAFGATAFPVGDTRMGGGLNGFSSGLLSQLEQLQAAQTVPNETTGREALHTALALAEAAYAPGFPVEIHILTDGAFSDPSLGSAADTTLPPLAWHIIAGESQNQAVVELAAYALSATRTQVFARLANYSDREETQVLTLLANGVPISNKNLPLDPRSTFPYIWEVSGVPESVGIAIVGGDDLAADNRAVTGLRPFRPIEVAVAAADPQPILAVLDAIQQVTQNISVVEYRPGNLYDLVIFQGEALDENVVGLALAIDPVGYLELDLSQEQVFTTISDPYGPEPLLVGVDFTGVRRLTLPVLPIPLPEQYQVMLQMQGILSDTASSAQERQKLPLVLRDTQNNPDLLLFLPSIGSSENPEPILHHPGFPVLVANLVAQAGLQEYPAALRLGEVVPLWPASQFPQVSIVFPEGEEVELGPDHASTWDGAVQPGSYRVTFTDVDGGETSFALGINAGAFGESNLEPREWTKEAAQLPVQTTGVDSIAQQLDLTPWVLLLALLILFWEAWLAWR